MGRVTENALALAMRDAYPVTPLHTLVVPRRHVPDFFELGSAETRACKRPLQQVRRELRTADTLISGFNLGVNVGTDAGQTVGHAHIHLIPRRAGDVKAPKGGIRGVIPGKADY